MLDMGDQSSYNSGMNRRNNMSIQYYAELDHIATGQKLNQPLNYKAIQLLESPLAASQELGYKALTEQLQYEGKLTQEETLSDQFEVTQIIKKYDY